MKHRAVAIFTRSPRSRARFTAAATDEVSFHELGGWDSIADMVGAAALVDSLPGATWTVSASAARTRAYQNRAWHGCRSRPSKRTAVEGL